VNFFSKKKKKRRLQCGGLSGPFICGVFDPLQRTADSPVGKP
jgi:hypothetical protein